jgi:hypothetical protein
MFNKISFQILFITVFCFWDANAYLDMQKLSLQSYMKDHCKLQAGPKKGKMQWDHSQVEMQFLRGLAALKEFDRTKTKEDFELLRQIVKSFDLKPIKKELDAFAQNLPQILSDVEYLKHAAFGKRRGITEKMITHSLFTLRKNLSITSTAAVAHSQIFEKCSEMNTLHGERPEGNAEKCAPLIRAYPQFLNLMSIFQSLSEDVGKPCKIPS